MANNSHSATKLEDGLWKVKGAEGRGQRAEGGGRT
jgi:hypothetical protein